MKENKILIDFDKEGAEKKIRRIEAARTNLSRVYKALTEIIGEPATKDEFLSIFEDNITYTRVTDARIRDLYISKKAPAGMIGGVPINLEMIATPDTSVIRGLPVTIDEKILFFHDYLSIKDGNIVTTNGYSVRATEEFKIYAETPEELKRYHLAKNLAEAWNAVAKTLEDATFYETLRPEHLRTVIDSDNVGIFHPSPYYIKTGKVSEQYTGLVRTQQAGAGGSAELSDSYIESLLQDDEGGETQPSDQAEPTPAYMPDYE